MALHLAEIKCEIREIRLSNKPEQMLEVSPKGTVPILILEDKVIDESYDIVNWVIEQSNIFNDNLESDQIDLTESLINIRFAYNGFYYTLLLFLSVWICDTFAYFFGLSTSSKSPIN